MAGLFRLPAADGPVWLKAIPPFAAAEPAATAAVADVDPDLVPTVLASAPGRIDRPPPAIPDRRPEVLAAAVRDLLDGPVGAELRPEELRAASDMQERSSSTSPTRIWATRCWTGCGRSTTCPGSGAGSRLRRGLRHAAVIRHALAGDRVERAIPVDALLVQASVPTHGSRHEVRVIKWHLASPNWSWTHAIPNCWRGSGARYWAMSSWNATKQT
jgi:hypothetical protein